MRFPGFTLAFLVVFASYESIVVSAEWPSSCSDYKQKNSSLKDGNYVIDPDGEGGVTPFTVLCNMSDEAGVGVTVISHDSEQRTLVNGFEEPGSYSRNVKYTGANLTQLAGLTQISIHCEQFIRYECFNSLTLRGDHAWLVSRDGVRMTYWGGASPGSKKCACGMNNTCVNPIDDCNCDANDAVWREDSGLLTHKPDLPVSQLRFGDTGSSSEKGYHTLGKMRCYGRSCTSNPCLNGGTCIVLLEGYNCSCAVGFTGSRCEEESAEWPSSCSDYKHKNSSLKDGNYVIDPDRIGGVTPFIVFCNMSDQAGVGVTVISHNKEQRTLVNGFEEPGSYSRNVEYTGATLTQLAGLTRISTHCEQFIRYECLSSVTLRGDNAWLVSRDGVKMTYWGGASPGSKKCACGMNNTCANPIDDCNCDANDAVWREDGGLLTHKPDLPVSQLRFGDTGYYNEEGYHTLGKLRCYGRKACTSNPCLNGGTCIVLFEGYNCSCAVGFTGSRCEKDEDECTIKEVPCPDPHHLCKNTLGSYTCECKGGFSGDSKSCADVNECLVAERNNCHEKAECVNSNGSYSCRCKQGFTGNGQLCSDVNECSVAELNNCHEKAECVNSNGSYSCRCKQGFTGNGQLCSDVNECSVAELNNCHEKAECVNSNGSYSCRCKQFFTGNGVLCTAVSPCAWCHARASCQEKPKVPWCLCDPGYTGDGKNCHDIKECETGIAQCDKNAKCVNVPGSYLCTCKVGYTGDGKACSDIDECKHKVEELGCSPNSTCVNHAGSFFCKCNHGYMGDGATCYDAKVLGAMICADRGGLETCPKGGGYMCRCRVGHVWDKKTEKCHVQN